MLFRRNDYRKKMRTRRRSNRNNRKIHRGGSCVGAMCSQRRKKKKRDRPPRRQITATPMNPPPPYEERILPLGPNGLPTYEQSLDIDVQRHLEFLTALLTETKQLSYEITQSSVNDEIKKLETQVRKTISLIKRKKLPASEITSLQTTFNNVLKYLESFVEAKGFPDEFDEIRSFFDEKIYQNLSKGFPPGYSRIMDSHNLHATYKKSRKKRRKKSRKKSNK